MLWRTYKGIEEHLAGWPDQMLSVMLILAAIVLVVLALKAPATVKAAAAAYVYLP
jgi:hypothetical protein